MSQAQLITRATHGDSLADILERVLNTGVVIAGDIRIKLCDVELLSIQIRLLICSVEKAKELGISWWWQTSPQTAPATTENAFANRFFRTASCSVVVRRIARISRIPTISRDRAGCRARAAVTVADIS